MSEYEKPTRSIWSKGYEPVPFDTENLERYMNGAKVEYAHEIKPWKFIQVVFNNKFISFDELYYASKENDLRVDSIHAIPNEDNPNIGKIQVNFYRGFEEYE
jgi:hypothetical protein